MTAIYGPEQECVEFYILHIRLGGMVVRYSDNFVSEEPYLLAVDTTWCGFYRSITQLAAVFVRVTCLAYFSTMKMVAVRCFETPVKFY
jgi:hypothetical protein